MPMKYQFQIDLKGLTAENQANLILHTSGKNNYAVLKFSNATSETPSLDSEAKLRDSSYSYMVVFPYGSTVMFNMHDEEVDGYLEIIRRHASGLLETIKDGASFQNYHIKYEVRENSNLPMWMQGGQGYVMLQHLDIDVIHVISSVLGQSIALDYYVRKADGVIAAFTELPRARWTIRSNIMRKKRMNQLVGSANSTLAELIVKVGLFDRIDLMRLMTENEANVIPHTPGIGNYIVLKFSMLTDSPHPPPFSYILVFKYGSTIMFNVLDHQVDGYLNIIKKHASGKLPERTKDRGDSSQNYIDYEVVSEKLKLPPCVQDGSDHMMLQNFNIDGICTIASALGQSVALDYYSCLVDELISAYTDVNIGLKESGTTYNFENILNKDLINENLLKLLRADADIVRWFGLYERSDVAWKEDSEYTHMLDHLRDELNLTQRFADLDRKFKMAELNIWFVGDEMNVPRYIGHFPHVDMNRKFGCSSN
ncbi:hypothetical protein C5167_028897 [Papaver somniferum]|nr:hypothetical protein C5167_028897 [Papaver somniferum]